MRIPAGFLPELPNGEVPAPHPLIKKIVKIVIFEMLEFGLGGGEQLFADLDVTIHGAAHIDKQQDFHAIAAFRPHANVQ